MEDEQTPVWTAKEPDLSGERVTPVFHLFNNCKYINTPYPVRSSCRLDGDKVYILGIQRGKVCKLCRMRQQGGR